MENQCQEPSQLEKGLNLAINEDQVNALNDLTLVGQLLTNKRILIGDFNALLTHAGSWFIKHRTEALEGLSIGLD